jgi:hypothetical protein
MRTLCCGLCRLWCESILGDFAEHGCRDGEAGLIHE